MLAFHYGFPGDVEQDDVSNPMAPTFGFNLRGDVPIERYLVLGPLIQFGAWRGDTAPNRSYYVDVDLYIRARLPITTSSANLQIWTGVPIGLTLDFLGGDVRGASGGGFGWNVGVMLGGAVHFTPNFGLFTELGWVQHKMTHAADPDVYFRLAQWILNVGFVFAE